MWAWSDLRTLASAYSFTEAESLGELYIREVINFLEPAIEGAHPADVRRWTTTQGMASDLPRSAEEFVSYYLETRPEPRYAPQAFQISVGKPVSADGPAGELLFSWRGEYYPAGAIAVPSLPMALLMMSGLSNEAPTVNLSRYYTLSRADSGHVRVSMDLVALGIEAHQDNLNLPPVWDIPVPEFSDALAAAIKKEIENPAGEAVQEDWLRLARRWVESRANTSKRLSPASQDDRPTP